MLQNIPADGPSGTDNCVLSILGDKDSKCLVFSDGLKLALEKCSYLVSCDWVTVNSGSVVERTSTYPS